VRRSTRFLIPFVASLAMQLLAPTGVRADAKSEARKHFDHAMALIEDGQMAQAVVELERCYAIAPHYRVLYNLGQAYVTMGKPVEAVAAFERFLVEGGPAVSTERRKEVEQEIARQKVRIAVLEVRGVPVGCLIRVDGQDVGVAPLAAPIRLGIGAHLVEAKAEGYRPAQQTVVLVGEDFKVVDFTMLRLPPPKPEPAPAPQPAAPSLPAPPAPVTYTPPAPAPVAQAPLPAPVAESTPGSGLRATGVVLGVGGMLGLGGGAVCGYLSKKAHDDAVTQWKAYRDQDARASQGSAQDYAKAANIAFIAGGGLVLTGVILYLAAPSARPAQTQVVVSPVAGQGFVGLSTRGSW
jgi:hypothetical protein